MTGDEIKALRRTLDCTARKLGAALGVDQATVLAWEREELFPTKRHVDAMRALPAGGGEALTAGARAPAPMEPAAQTPFHALADPDLWKLFRKLVAYPELRAEVARLSADLDDPAA